MVSVAFRNVITTAGSFMLLLVTIKSVWVYNFLNVVFFFLNFLQS